MFGRSLSRFVVSSANLLQKKSNFVVNKNVTINRSYIMMMNNNSVGCRLFGSAAPKTPAHHNEHDDHDHDEHDEHDDHEHEHEEPVDPQTWMLENPDTYVLRDDHPGYPYSQLVDETLPQFTLEEVARHNKREDCWIIVHGKVYNVTSYVDSHPGGDVILAHAGRDSSTIFDRSPMTSNAWVIMKDYFIGYCPHVTRYDGFNRSNRKGSHYLSGYDKNNQKFKLNTFHTHTQSKSNHFKLKSIPDRPNRKEENKMMFSRSASMMSKASRMTMFSNRPFMASNLGYRSFSSDKSNAGNQQQQQQSTNNSNSEKNTNDNTGNSNSNKQEQQKGFHKAKGILSSITATVMGTTIICTTTGYLLYQYKKNITDDERYQLSSAERTILTNFAEPFREFFDNLFNNLREYPMFEMIFGPAEIHPVLPPPLPKNMGGKEFTLIIDINAISEVSQKDKHPAVYKRAGLDYFLTHLLPYYEIYLYSPDFQQPRAEQIIFKLDPINSYFSGQLFFDSGLKEKGKFTQNMKKVNREGNKVIFIESAPTYDHNNVINVGKFKPNQKDSTLIKLLPVLTDIGSKKVNDVRSEIAVLQDQSKDMASKIDEYLATNAPPKPTSQKKK
ncbi:putative mitochondrial import inner membrane translocase subunit 50 [Heterostelium album PN500]|uniref:Putative mitochondrial import inner membrane translocase subunit 50 n=1 Tax=Heterostelium pallidum (strain ATCC 26659 / Pp 5 / PN500) TaxID=670386 RepID=D3BKM0_HETP5|nr:putative mitochondrial import inner membrane translocase subunit 50 [Heterostelium album PN500]EFA78450.1 putative mitochondrial import inner membrane translocase subunit 50 [Heterostelium album PN500]|eukprot:XP_020430575.1 putative mitochondrial import inner membrane translocase subunit 50 [Heterostelium album PN500]